MIKKIIWTIILIAPVLTVGVVGIVSNNDSILNSSNAVSGWTDFFKFTTGTQEWGTGNILHVILLGVLALFWTAPLWYTWKGTSIIGFPVIGLILRLSVFLILIFVPGIIGSLVDTNWSHELVFWMGVILISFAMIGLWFKS